MIISHGPIDAKIWVIDQCPSSKEREENNPYAGTSGKFLKSKYALFGLNKSKIHFEYLSSRTNARFGQEVTPEVAQDIHELKMRIANSSPNVILLLGDYPLYHLGGRGNLKGWRGNKFWSEELGCKCVATYRPQQIMRQRYLKKSENPGQWEALFHNDLLRITQEAKTKELKFADYNLITNLGHSELVALLQKIKKEGKIIGYDIETTGGFNIDCLALSWDRVNSVCIPWYIGGKTLDRFWSEDAKFYEIYKLVKEILEGEIPKVAQNSQFDTLILEYFYDIRVNNLTWDTMVAAHELYSDLPKDLGTLISMYTNLPYMKELIHSNSLEDRWKYNAMDALANIHIMDGEMEEMHALHEEYGTDVYSHYITVTHPAIRVITDMQRIGVKTDDEIRPQAVAQEHERIRDIQEAIEEIFPEKFSDSATSKVKFSPGGWQDKQKLFYNAFKCKNVYHQRKLTTNKGALDIWAKDERDFVRILAESIMIFQQSRNMLGKLEAVSEDGRMRSAYTIGGYDEVDDKDLGTDTGRLASKKSILGSGTNLQNLKKGLQRQQLIPEEDEYFIYSDLWAAEALLVALDAKEETLLAMLRGGEKVHSWMLAVTQEKFPKECEELWGIKSFTKGTLEYDYAYKKSKITIHGFNYNGQPKKIAEETGLPLYVVEWQFSMYHTKFPGIQMRHKRVEKTVSKRFPLVSFLGRSKVLVAPFSQDLLNQCYAWKTQSTIGELTIIGMVKLYYIGVASEFYDKYPFLFPSLNTHDGLLTRVHKQDYDRGTKCLSEAFNIEISDGNQSLFVPLEYGRACNMNDVEDEQIVWYKGEEV